MASSITFRCHACKARIKAPPKLMGQVRPCPRCKQALRVRVEPPEDAGPILLTDRKEDTAVVPALREGGTNQPDRTRAGEDTKVILVAMSST
jgi:hypothetical protein